MDLFRRVTTELEERGITLGYSKGIDYSTNEFLLSIYTNGIKGSIREVIEGTVDEMMEKIMTKVNQLTKQI